MLMFATAIPPGYFRPSGLVYRQQMGWSAAATLLGDSPPGNEVVSCPATPPVALLGERRAAPPGTRLRGDFCHSFWHKERWQNITRRYPMKIHTIGIDL